MRPQQVGPRSFLVLDMGRFWQSKESITVLDNIYDWFSNYCSGLNNGVED